MTEQSDNNLVNLTKKTMVDMMRRYNQRVSKKIAEMKEDNMELLEQRRRYEETFDSETYMAGIGADEIVHRQFILNVISYYYSMNEQIRELIALKSLVNQNEGKMKVLNALLGVSPQTGSQAGSPKLAKADSPKPTIQVPTGASVVSPPLSELEAMIEAAQAEGARLTNSLTTTQARNKTLSSELAKLSDVSKAKRVEDLDKAIADQTRELDDIRKEIAMVSSAL